LFFVIGMVGIAVVSIAVIGGGLKS